MPALPSALPILALAAALFLAGCDSEPTQPPAPQSPLHRCIGEAGYSNVDWEKLIAELKANPVPCPDSVDSAKPVDLPGLVPSGHSSGDSLDYTTYVMDNQCRPLAEFRGSLRAPAGHMVPIFRLWDLRDANGHRVPTGEYYLNTEIEWIDGGKDTTYQKIGMINFNCPE